MKTKEELKERHRLYNYVIARIYAHQKESFKRRGHKLYYTKEEFLNFCLNSPKFALLLNNWARSNYDKDLYPSFDRVDDKVGYKFSNLNLVTWKENREKQYNLENRGVRSNSFKPKEYYGSKLSSRTNMKKICKNNNWDFDDFLEIFKGDKGNGKNKRKLFYYVLKEKRQCN